MRFCNSETGRFIRGKQTNREKKKAWPKADKLQAFSQTFVLLPCQISPSPLLFFSSEVSAFISYYLSPLHDLKLYWIMRMDLEMLMLRALRKLATRRAVAWPVQGIYEMQLKTHTCTHFMQKDRALAFLLDVMK